MLKSASLARQGDVNARLAEFEHGLSGLRGTGARLGMTWYFSLHAELLAQTGQIWKALDVVEEALAFAEETGERMNRANLLRLKGALLFEGVRAGRDGGLDAAEACLAEGLRVAMGQGAKLLALRAAIGCASLHAHRRRFEEGLAVLRPVYESFSEGLAMPDPVDARRLIAYLERPALCRVPVSDAGGGALLEI